MIAVNMYNMAHCPGQHNLGGSTTWSESSNHFFLAFCCLSNQKEVGGPWVMYTICTVRTYGLTLGP